MIRKKGKKAIILFHSNLVKKKKGSELFFMLNYSSTDSQLQTVSSASFQIPFISLQDNPTLPTLTLLYLSNSDSSIQRNCLTLHEGKVIRPSVLIPLPTFSCFFLSPPFTSLSSRHPWDRGQDLPAHAYAHDARSLDGNARSCMHESKLATGKTA